MHKLPDLPYDFKALEPYIDEETMRLHHGKHHQAYIDKLNAAIENKPELKEKSVKSLIADLASLPDDIRMAVRNNGGGHYNHSVFWEMMAPGQSGQPDGKIAEAINSTFGGFETFQEKFTEAAVGRFGAGWAWLIDNGGKLEITSTGNQDNPISSGQKVVLGLDVWEHAYYLKYQNRRPEYIENWWKVVNWQTINSNLA